MLPCQDDAPAGGTEGGVEEPTAKPPAAETTPEEANPDQENQPARVVGFAAEPADIETGGTSVLHVQVEDPEQDPFHIWWQSSCGAVSPRPPRSCGPPST